MAKAVYDRKSQRDIKKSSELRDIYIRHGINLTRYSTYEARKLQGILDTANTQIKDVITRAKAIETKEKYHRVAAEIKRMTNELTEKLDRQLEFDFKELAEEEARFVEKAMRSVNVTADFDIPAPAKIWAAASFETYSGYRTKETYESYINTFGDNVFKTWDSNVRAGYLAGLTAQQINRAVLGSVKDMEPGQMKKLRKSLEMNTRTMVAHLAETARDSVYKANSRLFSGYRYIGTLDSRTCLECGVLDGKVFEGSEVPKKPELPQHPNCVLGDTLISACDSISSIFRRAYEGEIIVITTSSGNILRVTPNHPILCDVGFIPAKFIKAGDNLVVDNCLKIIPSFNKSADQKVSRIEDIFSSLRVASGMKSKIVPLSAKDFHGDVAGKEVEIIYSAGVLSFKSNAVIHKMFGKLLFIFRVIKNLFVIYSLRMFNKLFKRPLSAFRGKMGLIRQFCNIFFRSIFHSFNLLFFYVPLFNSISSKEPSHICPVIAELGSNASNANTLIIKFKNFFNIRRNNVSVSERSINAGILKNKPDSFIIDRKLSRNIFNKYKRFIKFDNVLSVSIIENFSGHVYNLETKNNWYVANNIIIHNCRCLWLPEIKGMEGFDEDDERASVDGPVSANMTYEEWLKTQDDETVKDILGPTRFEMYKNGEPITAFVADGSMLNLKQLAEKDGITKIMSIMTGEQIEKLNNAGILVTSEKELKQGLTDFKKHVKNMEEPYKNIYSRYAETTELRKDDLLMGTGIGYDQDKDAMVYNKRALGIAKYQQPANIVFSHELAHRYDILEIKSWENKEFVGAIEAAMHKVQGNVAKYNDLYGSLKNTNPAYQDILSALSDNKINVACGHESSYWAYKNNRALEIFANASYIQANHINIPEFDGLLDDIMKIADTMFTKGAK
jgi:hypothetical protein